jgi:hypothetical protein
VQHSTDSAVATVEAGKFRYGKGALANALGRQAIDRRTEAGQLVQRTGQNSGALSAD